MITRHWFAMVNQFFIGGIELNRREFVVSGASAVVLPGTQAEAALQVAWVGRFLLAFFGRNSTARKIAMLAPNAVRIGRKSKSAISARKVKDDTPYGFFNWTTVQRAADVLDIISSGYDLWQKIYGAKAGEQVLAAGVGSVESAAAAYHALLFAQSKCMPKGMRTGRRNLDARDAALAMWVIPKSYKSKPYKPIRHMNRISWRKVKSIRVQENDGVTASTRVTAIGIRSKNGRRFEFEHDLHWVKVTGGWLITSRQPWKQKPKPRKKGKQGLCLA